MKLNRRRIEKEDEFIETCLYCDGQAYINGDTCFFCLGEGCEICAEIAIIGIVFCKNKQCKNYGGKFVEQRHLKQE